MVRALVVSLLLIAQAGNAAGAEPEATASSQAEPPTPPQTTTSESAKSDSTTKEVDPFAFDLELPQKAATPNQMSSIAPEKLARLESQVRTRRKLLKAHLYLGISTLALMAATLVIGQLDYYDKFSREGTYTARFQKPHLGLAVGTTVTFTATALVGIFAPNPYPKPVKADAALAHKILMGIATAGMLAQLILGPISASRSGTLQQRDLATTHLVIGYTTFAAMAAGTLAFVF